MLDNVVEYCVVVVVAGPSHTHDGEKCNKSALSSQSLLPGLAPFLEVVQAQKEANERLRMSRDFFLRRAFLYRRFLSLFKKLRVCIRRIPFSFLAPSPSRFLQDARIMQFDIFPSFILLAIIHEIHHKSF